jgi:hypothetical protein
MWAFSIGGVMFPFISTSLLRSYLKNIFWRNSKLVFGLPDFTTRFA